MEKTEILQALKGIQEVYHSSNPKVTLAALKDSLNDKSFAAFRYALKFLYNKDVQPGFTPKTVRNATGTLCPVALSWCKWLDTSEGPEYANCLAETLAQVYGEDLAEIYIQLRTKKLPLGISPKTWKAVFKEDLITVHGTMQAINHSKLSSKALNTVDSYTMTNKYDGINVCMVVGDNTEPIKFVAGRNWKTMTGFTEIAEYATDLLKYGNLRPNTVYEGEMLATGLFDDSIKQRQKTTSICLSKGEKLGLRFVIYDMVDLVEFMNKQFTTPYLKRRKQLESCIPPHSAEQCIEYAPVIYNASGMLCDVLKAAEGVAQDVWSNGGEGIILNSDTAPYHSGRDKRLIKFKKVDDMDLRCVGWELGDADKGFYDTCGALIVEYKGHQVRVGTGLSKLMRDRIACGETKLEGKIITVATLGESRNKEGGYSLNAPTFVCVRFDKEEADY